MSQKKLRSLSELQVTQAIDLAKVRIYQIVHNGQKDRYFAPKRGTQLYRVWNSKKLDIRQQTAWKRFTDHFQAAEGNSGKVTGSYGEYSGGDSEKTYIPQAYANKPLEALEFLYEQYLTREESALLRDLLREELQMHNDFTLEMVGLIRSGYKGTDEARIAGTVTVQNLLTRLATFYERYSISASR